MTKIAPLKAIRYNQDKIADLSRVVCPPYDVISPQAQQYYHDTNPYNFIHILLGQDIPGEDKYKRAANYFNEWLKERVLTQEENPSIYLYSQQYTVKGEKKTRIGFIARLGLDEDNRCVFGHEHTHLEAKEDRLKLVKAVKANLSPIFVVFADKKRIIQRIYNEYAQKAPIIDISDEDKVAHRIWRVDSPELITSIQTIMSGENVFIADGHHRYEVSCVYRDLMRSKFGTLKGDESFNYTMAYFTNTDPRNLAIMPIHRLVKLKSENDIKTLFTSATDYFSLEEIKDKNKFFFLMEKVGGTEHVLGVYVNKRYWLFRLKNVGILDKIISDKPKDYRSLDVSVLNYLILKKILKFDLEDKGNISFNPKAEELIEQVDNKPGLIAFFLNPVRIQQVMSVALSGNKMPPKSTYFYPKVLSGLVINKFNEDVS